MWPLSTGAGLVLKRPHSIKVRATAYSPGLGSRSGLPISGGSVTVDASSQVRRTATLEIADHKLWPANPLDLLSPFGAELQVDYGIVVGANTEWIPLIRGVVTDADRDRSTSSPSGVTLSLSDRSAKIAEDRFDAPTQTVSGALTTAEIARLITESMPSATVVNKTGSSQVAAVIELNQERWSEGVEKLADSIGAEVFCDPQGTFIIRSQPTLGDAVVWEIKSGRGGVLVAKHDKLTREKVYNRVIAVGERTDGTAPVRAVVSDADPTSPTMYGGTFGKKPYFFTSPLLTTTGMCTAAATTRLARVKGIQATVSLDIIVNPALDAGDVVRVWDEGKWQIHIIDKLTVPLSVSQSQSIQTRSLDVE